MTETKSEDTAGPVQPHSMEAEQGLLGTILNRPDRYDRIADMVDPDSFYVAAHARIYEAIQAATERGQRADPVTLAHRFKTDEDLKDVGGPDYLSHLVAQNLHDNPYDYARVVRDMAARRRLLAYADDIRAEAGDDAIDKSAAAMIETAEQGLNEIGLSQDSRDAQSISAVMSDTLRDIQARQRGDMTPVRTGIAALDGKLHIERGDLCILAARPSMGKSALAGTIALNAGFAGERVYVSSMEMGAQQWGQRWLARMTGINTDAMKTRGSLTQSDFDALIEAQVKIDQVKAYVDDQAGLSVARLAARARRQKRKMGGIDLLVVDYLQLMSGRGENRTAIITNISRALKSLAKELHCAVLCLSQLSRSCEHRENKRPMLADLRESGSIEQDADQVAFIYRDEYYLEREEPRQKDKESASDFQDRLMRYEARLEDARGMADVIIAKNRHGEVGEARLQYVPHRLWFKDPDTWR